MRPVLSPLLAAVLGGLLALPGPAQAPSTEVGVGLFPFLVGNMDSRVREVVDKLVAENCDLLYVSVFRATGPSTGDLWITDAGRNWNGAWGRVRPGGAGIDLRALIAYAHQRAVRVVGVVKCFDDTVQPTDAAHRQYVTDVIGWLVDSRQPNGEPTYDLDGIALDYVRFVGGGSGGQHALVTDFVRGVRERVGALSLHAYVIASRFYIDGPTYDGSFRTYSQAMSLLRSDFGQDWPALAQYLDVLMPMCYTADGSIYSSYALHQGYVRAATTFAVTARAAAGAAGAEMHVQPVVRTYNTSDETTTAQTVEASITGALLGGADGYQTFRYATTASSWWAKVAQYAVPGPNFPRPGLQTSAIGLTLAADAGASIDADGGPLSARYDFDDDGVFDTGWLPVGATAQRLAPAPGSRWVGLRVRDAEGNVAAQRRYVGVANPLAAPPTTVSASAPVRVDLALDCGPAAIGGTYAVFGTLSGTAPGTVWQPGFVLPLNLDGVSESLLLAANTPVFPGAIGTLDAAGRGRATLTLPAGVLNPLVFRVLHFAAIGTDPAGRPAFVTNPVGVVVIP